MKSREEIILDMCYTYRHDYGLNKNLDDPPWLSGMTKSEREGLYRTMSQIYDNNVAPLLQELKNLQEGNAVTIPKDKEHAEFMVKMGMFYLNNQKDKK